MSDVAVCPRDDEPLVWTFEFPGHEWHCVVCGAKYGVFGCNRVPASIELAARHAELSDRYEAERAERTGQPPPPLPDQTGRVTCGGCGRQPLALEGRLDDRGKPALWYTKTVDGVTSYACSRACIGMVDTRSGDKTSVLPW